MSSLVNKVKDALSSDNKTTSQPEGTSGPHNTRTANAADPRVDSDRDHRAGHNLAGQGNYTTGGNYTATGGNHSALGGSHSTTTGGQYGAGGDSRAFGTDGPASKTDGPHNSNLLNKADPRVDSDRDHSRNMGANPQGTSGTGSYNVSDTTGSGGAFFNGGRNQGTTGALSSETYAGNQATHTGGLGTTGTHHQTGTHHNTGNQFGTIGTGTHTTSSGLPEGSTGPHNSRIANAADPRVDSDRDGSRNLPGGNQSTHTTGGLAGTGGHHTSGNQFGTTGTGTHHTTTSSGLHEGTTGPHNSRVANAVDPRVDSDRDNSRNLGTTGGTHTSAHTGTHTGTHTTGSHAGTGAYGTTGGTGPAPNTAGPHKSDMLNKLDPRVDSNLDGSKTVGRDQTFSQSSGTGSMAQKDPTDAAQVPPSVLQKHVGAPTVEHGDVAHDRARRHSVSHQEQHRGL
ncbi:Fc.00g102870.m01.CDS01 [Cosmosporella sp. VM-42]